MLVSELGCLFQFFIEKQFNFFDLMLIYYFSSRFHSIFFSETFMQKLNELMITIKF